jgi:hypothetical protein
MNNLVKSAVAGALALTGTSAFAVTAPNTNSSDLVLVIYNTTTNAAYALDTGVTINSVLPSSALVSGASLNTSLPGLNTSYAASSTLSTFLAANPASGDQWTIEAAQFNGGGTLAGCTNGNCKTQGNGKGILTSLVATQDPTQMQTTVLSSMDLFINGLQAEETGGQLVFTGKESGTVQYGAGGNSAPSNYGMFGRVDSGAMGSTLTMFGFTGNNGTGNVESYVLDSVTVGTNGTVTFVGNGGAPPPVPIPAAVWLFGSGVLGLVGVSRRRKLAAV